MTFDLSDDELRRLGREAVEILVAAVSGGRRPAPDGPAIVTAHPQRSHGSVGRP